MIVYFRTMRHKDEHKQEAIIGATVKLVNEIGFVASSVSKIAKEAGVSPATIYIYYKNKDDLLISTYVQIKTRMGEYLLSDLNFEQPIRDVFRQVWFKMFMYVQENLSHFHFTEQFANSPYLEMVDRNKLEEPFMPLMNVLQKGIEQKIIKDVPIDILVAFLFYPIFSLSNKRLCHGFEHNDANIEQAYTLAWDAIKL